MDPKYSLLNRGRRSIAVDLKSPRGIQLVLKLVGDADALIEGFRPGVTERLGLGPEECFAKNPRLVYGRVTGWGQDGPLASAAGHDINYNSLAGAADCIGNNDQAPTPPLNLIGDFGGGAMFLALGVVAALLEAQKSGEGQVVDAAMVDGTARLMTAIYGMHGAGIWTDERQANVLDGGAHFYGSYETKDEKFVSIASIEAKFYDEFIELTEFEDQEHKNHQDRKQWPSNREEMKKLFKTKTQAEWCEILEGSDVCFAPGLSMSEAPKHPHNVARKTFVNRDGVVQPNPAPRFSRTPSAIQNTPSAAGADTQTVLADWGVSSEEVDDLEKAGVINAS